jgi:cyclopropane fatty-acyl-phospholipid synthase-like methyltransferase
MKNYWKNIKIKKKNFACPDIISHRFLGHYGFKYNKKKILEIGFFHGADLDEFNKRGSVVYGIDTNKNAVKILKKKYHGRIKLIDCTKDKINFNTEFDLIFCKDFVYYLNNNQIYDFLENLKINLNKNGIILVNFIINDFLITNTSSEYFLELNKFTKKYKFSEKKNPSRSINVYSFNNFLKKTKLKVVASKIHIESYGLKEKFLRVHKYLILKKI